MRILIAFGSTDGQTERIAEYLAQAIREQGYQADLLDVRRSDAAPPDGYGGVIVGASVHMGKHQRWVRAYVRENRGALERLPSAFFSVSLAAADHRKPAQQEVARYLAEFTRETGWRPGKVAVFAGALLYTRYGFFTRWIMKRIARSKGSSDLDTSRDYVYTDRESVRRFAEEFLATLVPEESLELSRTG
jgi:menaquinone-dependent protoporphyrinogen oxidase